VRNRNEVLDANSGVELSGLAGRIFAEADVAGKATLDPESINVIPQAEIEEWKKLAQPVIKGWVDGMNERGTDGNALLNSARRLTQKYNP
jgi:hypothetical protein